MTPAHFRREAPAFLPLPRLFVDDHLDRFPGGLTVQRKSKRYVYVAADDAGLDNLRGDAELYATPGMYGPEYRHLTDGARRVLAALARELPLEDPPTLEDVAAEAEELNAYDLADADAPRGLVADVDPPRGPYGCKCQSLAHRVVGDGCDECNPFPPVPTVDTQEG